MEEKKVRVTFKIMSWTTGLGRGAHNEFSLGSTGSIVSQAIPLELLCKVEHMRPEIKREIGAGHTDEGVITLQMVVKTVCLRLN